MYGIVQLFNKFERNMSQTFYSNEDVCVVYSIGKFLATVLQVRKSFMKLTNECNETMRLIDFNKNLYELVNRFKKKNKLLDYLKGLLIEDSKLTRECIEIVSEMMEGSAAVLVKANDKEICPVYTVGKKTVDWDKIVSELHLSKFNKQRVTMLRDLFSYGISAKMKSALIIFLKQGMEEYFLMVFREFTEFESFDEALSDKVASTLLMFDFTEETEIFKMKVENPRVFEINDTDSYNLLSILQEFKQKLNSLLDINSSSVYIVNQREQNFWTKSSNSSKSLVYPITPDSILGYTYLKKKIVLLPDYSKKFSDVKLYQDKYIVCLPVYEHEFTNPVIALVLITRSTQFTNSEISTLNKFSETLSCILYMDYLEIVKKWKVVHSSSMNLISRLSLDGGDQRFRQRASIMPVSHMEKPLEYLLECILNCDEVKFYEKEEFSDLDDINSALQNSRETGKYVYIDSNKESQTDSILVLPVGSRRLVFRNFPNTLKSTQIDSIYSIVIKAYSPKSIIEQTLEKTKQEGTISRWASQLVFVSSLAISKLIMCKSIVEKLSTKLEINTLIQLGVKLLKILTNSELVYCVIKEDNYLLVFKEDQIELEVSDEITNLFEQSSVGKSIRRLTVEGIHDNQIIVPIIHNEHVGMIVLSGKKDETHRDYCSYSSKDEKIVQDFVKAFAQCALEYPSPFEATLYNFSQYLYQIAIRYSPKDILNTVTKASQIIFDCDKVNLYFVNSGELRLLTQSFEEISPKEFSIQIEGIFDAVIQSGKAQFLDLLPSDHSYYLEIEKLTGYKTNSILVIPLKNTAGETFCLVECVNKFVSNFNEKDLTIADDVSKIYERVIENWEVTKKNIKEVYRLKGISNSLALIIMVFNKKGHLAYVNQQVSQIFSISEQEMKDSHYSEWLSPNKELKDDIETVFTNPTVHIRRTSQTIKPGKSKKLIPTTPLLFTRPKNVYNYRVVPLHTVSSGVVVILEDCSALEALHQGFRDVQDQIRSITSPIIAETGLQKCIRELSFIVSQVQSTDIRDQINEVLETLKVGSLKKPKFVLEDADKEEFETVNSIFFMQSEEFSDNLPDLEYSLSSKPDQTLLIPLSELRDWNLNAFKVENKFGYICTMLSDFNALEQFRVNAGVLFNFVKKVQLECDKRQNPFHNFTHCFSVMHSAYMLISSTIALNFFSGLNIFGILIAAICHDIDHTGRTNMFEINSKSSLAIIYNDKSVLEQHHAAVAFEILNQSDSNIFENIQRDSYRELRKIMITAIMGTDMAKHYSILTNINTRIKDRTNELGTIPKDTEKLAQFILHAADLAHPTKDYSVFEMWSLLVCQEFADQNKEETEKGMPITEFMKDLQNPKVYYTNEIGFLNFVVRPLWECAHNLLKSNVVMLVENLDKNIETMKLKLEEWKKVES